MKNFQCMSVKKKKITKKIKREIKRAVDGLPGLMIEHVKFKEIERPAELQKLPAPKHYDEIETHSLKTLPYYEDSGVIRQKKIWLWTGVTIFSAIVFLMWGWNMRAAFQDSFTNTKTKQPGITETAKTTWQDAMETNDLKNQIKNNLVSIFYVQAGTTASSTN